MYMFEVTWSSVVRQDKCALLMNFYALWETNLGCWKFTKQSYNNSVGKPINAVFTSHGRNILTIFQRIKPMSKS